MTVAEGLLTSSHTHRQRQENVLRIHSGVIDDYWEGTLKLFANTVLRKMRSTEITCLNVTQK